MDLNQENLKILRHSAAHLLAHAVSELFPGTQLTIGPATADGFFYDCLPIKNFKEEDLPRIEQRMHEISAQNLPIVHQEIAKNEARELYKNNPFKLELIDNIEGDHVGLAVQGDFYDLCRGGHVASTGDIKHFKLTGISGSYWRANRDGQALQRLHGTAFFTAQELSDYQTRLAELHKYDHRTLGKQMDLFSFHDEGPGFPFFHPKGQAVFNALVKYARKIQQANHYQEIATPMMLNEKLWHQSGHYAHYKENMYFSCIDNTTFAIKPMNCPGSALVYQTRPRSYRELPLKLSEYGRVHRHELSGVLHGLFRVRAFTQDDAHIYCTVDQIEEQILVILELIKKILNKFDFTNIEFALSTKPEKAMGSDQSEWKKATDALKNALNKAQIDYKLQEGDGAFYGPKIDIKIKDSMDREWQCGTVQVDFFLSQNFDLTYVNSLGTKERPVVIHHVLYGSLERFIGILLEHYKGHLPFLIAPIQARVLTITDEQKDYALQIKQQLSMHGLRVEVDESSDPISGKIKSAQLDKIPWMVVVGNKEVATKTVTLRNNDGQQEPNLTIEQLILKADLLNQ
jgi:threonyl-tRNA synthetase